MQQYQEWHKAGRPDAPGATPGAKKPANGGGVGADPSAVLSEIAKKGS